MTGSELSQGEALQDSIDLITDVQAKIASTGAKAMLIIVDADNNLLVNADTLKDAITEADYNTVVAAALSDLNTELSSTKTSKETALAAL